MHRIIVIPLAIALFSCGNDKDQVAKDALKSNVEASKILQAEIDSMERIVYTDTFNLNERSASDLMKAYAVYSEKFVGDKEKTPEYLYKSAALSRAVGLPVKAIKLYDKILVDYPNYERNPEVAFLIAFTYDEDIQELEQAKEAYQEVIDKYPGDMWAEQAAERLKTIDMSDEEMIEEFMKKNNISNQSAS